MGWCMRFVKYEAGLAERAPARGRPLELLLAAILLSCIVAACSAPATTQPALKRATPTLAVAGAEPVLPNSQIFFHDAPLPTQADFQAGAGAWTLAGHDSDATRSVAFPTCCSAQAVKPL